MTTESDRLLIARVRKNDQAAWAELDRRYRARRTAYVRRRLKDEWAKVMALELLYVKGWGNAEVAAKLKRTEQDVANLKFQAKKRLHDHLTAANLSPAVFPELQEQ